MNKLKLHTHISEIEREAWKNLLDNSPYASFFQSPQCYEFYASLSFMQPFVFAVSEDDVLKGLVCGYIIADGGMIKRYFSRRAIIPGGLLLAEDISDYALTLLLNHTKKELKHKAIYIEIRNYKDYSIFKSVFELVGFAYQPHLNFHLNSSYYELAFKNLNRNKRRYIRLSKDEGAEWALSENEDEVKSFYDILKALYTEKVGLPLFPLEFFVNLSKITESKFILVKYNNKIIGGGVYVILKNKAIYEWFICGEDKKYKNVYPSILATWGGIEYATQNNLPLFDFMGAGKPDIEYGVRQFKSEFGGELVEHGRYLFVAAPLLYKLGKKMVSIIQKR